MTNALMAWLAEPQRTTQVIAWLGAITGTLSLYLSFRQHRRDRAELRVTPQFEYTTRERHPPGVSLQVKLANVGRRPVTAESILVEVRAPTWQLRMRRWLRFGSSWHDLPIYRMRGTTLAEAEVTSFRLDAQVFGNVELFDISRFAVRDAAGNLWKSVSDFGQSKARNALTAKVLQFQQLPTTGGRSASIEAIEMRDGVDLLVWWRLSGGGSAQTLRVAKNGWRVAMTEAESVLQAFVAGDLTKEAVSGQLSAIRARH